MGATLSLSRTPARAGASAPHAGQAAPAASGARLWWLGQAGFLIQGPEATVLIDPYLSDSLAGKYRGREPSHERMMPPPVAPGELTGVTHVLATHGHTDHLDPGTLPAVAAANPAALFVVPRAVLPLATERGVPADRLAGVDAGETLNPGSRTVAAAPPGEGHTPGGGGLALRAVPAAHERLETDGEGNSLYLGYVFTVGGVTFYHSGDCVPFPGQVQELHSLGVDVALLPVNGRDAARGVKGNYTVREALRLASEINSEFLVCHHWGMFAFNTADPAELRAAVTRFGRENEGGPEAIVPAVDECYGFSR